MTLSLIAAERPLLSQWWSVVLHFVSVSLSLLLKYSFDASWALIGRRTQSVQLAGEEGSETGANNRSKKNDGLVADQVLPPTL